jgi:hypothetical protein
MSKLLLTGAVSAVAYKVKSVLNREELVIGDFMPLPPMPGLLVLPSPLSPSYLNELLKCCLAEGINGIVPLRRSEVQALIGAKALFSEYDIAIFLPDDFPQVPDFRPAESENIQLYADGLKWQDKAGTEYLLFCDNADLC